MPENISKILIPVSVVIAGLIIAGAFIYLDQGKESVLSESLSAQEIAEKAMDYINENFNVGDTASLVDVSEVGSVYKIRLKVGDREYDSYATKDGEFLFPEGYNLEETPVVQETEDEPSQSLVEGSVSSEELIKFISCLREANFVIYGANWCGWTQKLVEMLGGFDMVKPIYVECAEEVELCKEKGVTAYPTVLIKEEKYQGDRTFEEIAAVTGCEVPSGAGSLSEEGSGEGGCQ